MTEAPPPNDSFKMDFSGFILSLNTSALIHLGEIPDPQSNTQLIFLKYSAKKQRATFRMKNINSLRMYYTI